MCFVGMSTVVYIVQFDNKRPRGQESFYRQKSQYEHLYSIYTAECPLDRLDLSNVYI